MLLMFFFNFSSCFTWGYWSLVTHKFTSAVIGSNNTFILHHNFLRSILLVTTPLNWWLQQLNNFLEHGNHGYCGHKHHSMSDVVLIVGGSTHKIWVAICVLPKDCWIGWLVLGAEDSVDDYPSESRRLPSARQPNEFSPFL